MGVKIEKLYTEQAKIAAQALKDNDGYCPCCVTRSEDTKCMCKEFHEMEAGICRCGLYKKTKI